MSSPLAFVAFTGVLFLLVSSLNRFGNETRQRTTTLDVTLCVLFGNRNCKPKRVIRWRARGRDDVRRRCCH
jgi:hypothetical protein